MTQAFERMGIVCVQAGDYFMAWNICGYECWQEVLESIHSAYREMAQITHGQRIDALMVVLEFVASCRGQKCQGGVVLHTAFFPFSGPQAPWLREHSQGRLFPTDLEMVFCVGLCFCCHRRHFSVTLNHLGGLLCHTVWLRALDLYMLNIQLWTGT